MAKNEQTWHIRVQLFRFANKGEGVLEADTHPDWSESLPLDATEAHKGMWAVLRAVSEMVHRFHEAELETIEGARLAELGKRVPTIRVYVSSHGGRTKLQVPYTPDGNVAWKAIVTIQREDWQPPLNEGDEPPRPSLRVAQ